MARKHFIGAAEVVVQISSVQITSYDAATTYTITIGDWSASSIAAGSASAAATELSDAIDAETTHPHAKDLDGSTVTDTLTVTGKSDGTPFVLSVDDSGGTGTFGSISTTAAESPYHWDVAGNWSDGAVPVSTDDVDLTELTTPILWGIDQNAVELGTLRHLMSFTGNIGLDPFQYTANADGTGLTASAREYRNQRLRIGADLIDLGIGDGNGAGRIAVENTQSGATTMRVRRTAATPARSGLMVVDVKLDDASALLLVEGGTVGVCANIPGESGECDIAIPTTSASTRVQVGDAVTVGDWIQREGNHVLRSAATVPSVVCHNGDLLMEGAFAVSDITVDDGTVVANNVAPSGDDIGAGTLRGGVLDGSRVRLARTFDGLTVHPGAELRVNDTVTLTTLAFAAGPIALAFSRP